MRTAALSTRERFFGGAEQYRYGPGSILAILLFSALFGVGIAFVQEDAFFILLAAVLCVFIFFDFRLGVVLLILFIPIANSSIFPHKLLGITGLNPLNVLLFGTLACYFLSNRRGESFKGFMPRPLLWLYVVPILIAGLIGMGHVNEMALQLTESGVLDFNNAFGYIRDVVVRPLFFVLFSLLIAAAVARSRDPESFLFPTVLAVCIMSVLVVVFVYLSGYSLTDLSSAAARTFFQPIGVHANDLGRLYAVAYGLLLFTFARTDRQDLKLPLIIGMVATVVALVLTFSRGAFVGFMVINLLFLLSRRNALTFVLFAVLLALALIFMPGTVYERVTLGFDANNLNVISAGRTEEIWEPLMPEMLKSPIWGSGLLSITWSSAMKNGLMLPVSHPHNAYLQAFLDMGIVGLVLLLAYFKHVWEGFRKLSKDASLSPGRQGFFQGAAAGLVSLMIAGVAGGGLTPGAEQTFLWVAIGMMYGEQARALQAKAAEGTQYTA